MPELISCSCWVGCPEMSYEAWWRSDKESPRRKTLNLRLHLFQRGKMTTGKREEKTGCRIQFCLIMPPVVEIW